MCTTVGQTQPGLAYLHSLAEWLGNKFDKANISGIAEFLGNPQNKVKAVHVAGTNGKGSVSATISSILGAAGYRVGLTTSPHLSQMNERIVIDGVPIDDELLSNLAFKVKKASEELNLPISFFEAMTLCAFLCFAELGLDWMVLEVGLGGRLDATNIISKPEIAVITSIDLDHEGILGNGKVAIAREKAGIIKPNIAVVVGPVAEEALEAIAKIAAEQGSELISYGKDYRSIGHGDKSGIAAFQDGTGEGLIIKPSLRGKHQVENAGVAAMAAKKIGISDSYIKQGIETAFWPARLETLWHGQSSLLLDSAHNPAGIQALRQFLAAEGIEQIDLCFGAIESKDWQQMIVELQGVVRTWFLLQPAAGKAVDTAVIADHLSCLGIKNIIDYGSDYHKFIRKQCPPTGEQPSSALVAAGSIYMIGKLRELLVHKSKPLWQRKAGATC